MGYSRSSQIPLSMPLNRLLRFSQNPIHRSIDGTGYGEKFESSHE